MLGGIALRYGSDDYVGWAGQSATVSAPQRAGAGWPAGRSASCSRRRERSASIGRCSSAVDNLALAKTIEHCGGVLESITVSKLPVRRYWIDL